jgi:DNA-binding transcriptional ArsR family regulator
MYGQPHNALVIASEDSNEIDLKPRVVVAGGDPARVSSIKGSFRLPDDAPWLIDLAEKIGDVGLIVIDPLGNHTGGANTDRESDVRQALMPLAGAAVELRCPIIGVRHITTKASAGSALGKILGSTAWIAVPRVALIAALDADGVLHVRDRKANRVAVSEAGSSFRIEGRFPPGFKESVACLVPLGTSDVDVDELLIGSREPRSNSEEARELILDLLDADGETESDELDRQVAEQTSLSARTVRNIRSELNKAGLIRSKPERDEGGADVRRWLVSRTQAPRARGNTPSRDLHIPPVDHEVGRDLRIPPVHHDGGPTCAREGTAENGRNCTLDEALEDTAFVAELSEFGVLS